MTNRCEDYPCCGHTDGLGCNWTAPDYSNDPHLMCDHEAGMCDVWEDEDDECDLDLDLHDGRTWCYTHDQYGDLCEQDDEPDPMEDQWLDSYMEDRLTTMFEG